jgi:hypothetical protein
METVMPRSRRAHISTDDLEQALDYLDGLLVILKEFDDTRRGQDSADGLLLKLEDMDSQGGNWAALRYQTGAGARWHEVRRRPGRTARAVTGRFADDGGRGR